MAELTLERIDEISAVRHSGGAELRQLCALARRTLDSEAEIERLRHQVFRQDELARKALDKSSGPDGHKHALEQIVLVANGSCNGGCGMCRLQVDLAAAEQARQHDITALLDDLRVVTRRLDAADRAGQVAHAENVELMKLLDKMTAAFGGGPDGVESAHKAMGGG